MVCQNPGCLGNYDFDKIAYYARKRFVEGCDTVTLLQSVRSEREKEEIALVSMLDVEDEKIRDLSLSCKYDDCPVISCRDKLNRLIGKETSN